MPECEIPQAVKIDKDIFEVLRVDDTKTPDMVANLIVSQEGSVRRELAAHLLEALASDDEDTRWKLGHVVECLVLWEPRLVPPSVLEYMSLDPFFSVRSSAAVCYYYLAKLDPGAVPLSIVAKLASSNEDWYVSTPASSALLRLARSRPLVVDLLSQKFNLENPVEREYGAEMLKRLSQVDWDLISDELLSHMLSNNDPFVQQIGKECDILRTEAQQNPKTDYSLSF